MIASMTGYGRGEAEGGGYRLAVEVRTLNSRFLDLHLRLPRPLLALEDRLRKAVAAPLARGRVEINLVLEPVGESTKSIVLDRSFLAEARAALEEMRQLSGINSPVALEHLLSLPDVVAVKEKTTMDLEALWTALSQAVGQALDAVVAMRRLEGANLQAELSQRLDVIQSSLLLIQDRAALVPQACRDKLTARLNALLPDVSGLDETRLAQEIAMLVDRADITEELTRLASHLEQARHNLAATVPVGRKLDFLVQEMHREINTIGSKAADLQISQTAIDIKTDLERLREQIQNIE